jgi:tRNA (cmo5U34)-methyltransferase
MLSDDTEYRPTGCGVAASRSDFQFDSAASCFDEHVRSNVPFYDEVQDLIASLSDWYLCRDSLVLDLGCATGETSKRIATRHSELKGLRFALVDESAEMLEAAQKKLIGIDHTTYNKSLLSNWYQKLEQAQASFAVMAFTLQFIPILHRFDVLRSVRQFLRPGGALCLVEKVEGGVAEFERAFTRILDERKIGSGMSADEVLNKEASLRGRLVPLSLNENIFMLKKAGFREVEVFWRWLSFCGVIATWGRDPSDLGM